MGSRKTVERYLSISSFLLNDQEPFQTIGGTWQALAGTHRYPATATIRNKCDLRVKKDGTDQVFFCSGQVGEESMKSR